MKIAYLIAAHDQPRHLARLVQALRCSWAHIFIHIDAKAKMIDFQQALQPTLSTVQGVTFLPDHQRVAVYWGGFSQVQAALNLIKAAYCSDLRFTRYCLLSGSDFPIQDQATLQQALSTQTEFIAIDRKLDRQQPLSANRKHLKHIQKFYWRDRPNLWKRLASGLIPRDISPMIPIYQGSQWWSLGHDCITHILDFLSGHPQYIGFFKYTNCADEMFFHSIVKASPFADQISDDFENPRVLGLDKSLESESFRPHEACHTNVYGCHYIDWSAHGRSPKILEMTDFEALMRSQALFARKFREDVSGQLLAALAIVEHASIPS